MKSPPKPTHDSPDPPEIPPPYPQEDSNSAELSRCMLSEDQLSQAIKIISKVKMIKKESINNLKQKVPPLNHLFKIMSEFFIPRRSIQQKLSQDQKKLKKQLRAKATISKPYKTKDPPLSIDEESSSEKSVEVANPHESSCYICKAKYIQIDSLYPQHCPSCSEWSRQKRNQTADLKGLVALVTGARIKIGYEIALKLLRDGATVYATSRFTKDSYIRYQKEADFQEWKDRLFLIQCDFLSSSQVESLINYIKTKVTKLDILINNAAQTLTRPKEFYTFELENQQREMILPPSVVEVKDCTFPSIEGQHQFAIKGEQQANACIDLNQTDEFGQPLDLRETNTWRQKIEDVSLFDCLSTQVINSTVPFLLISRLKCLMEGPEPSWIINVSSMEGVFYRQWKNQYHPHTNMAKASLNMITRTCASQFSKSKIYMNSVDTGWVTNENPYHMAVKEAQTFGFYAPLDCVEGAMRVLDPIYQGVRDKVYPYGQFLKDYKSSRY